MTLDNIAALLIQPPVGAWSDRLRTPIGRRMPFILIGAPIGAIVFGIIPLVAVLPCFCCLHHHPADQHGILAHAGRRLDAGYHSITQTLTGKRSHQLHGWSWIDHFIPGRFGTVQNQSCVSFLARLRPGYPLRNARSNLHPRTQELRSEGEKQPGMLASLAELFRNHDTSAIRLFFAILFWFLAYTAVEAFFTLYVNKHLGQEEAEGPRLLGQLSLFFVLAALPSGLIGAKIGRRITIMIGIALFAGLLAMIFFIPVNVLIITIDPFTHFRHCSRHRCFLDACWDCLGAD